MESKWFVDENVKNIDKEILLCFPYAGASINMFSMWKEYIDKVIVCPVKLPFRDARRKEKLPESVQKLAEVFVKENIDIMRKRYSIFGHCTGAILGYEIARQTYEKTGNEPTVIIASSSQEPAIIPKEAILLAGASDSEIQAYLETERLVDKSILEMPEFQEYYFPILRADFRLFASYHASYHRGRISKWISASAEENKKVDVAELPQNDLEEQIARIWCKELNIERIGRNDNFYLSGGDSLLIAQVIARMRETIEAAKRWSWDDLLKEMMKTPTIRGVAKILSNQAGENEQDKSLVIIKEAAESSEKKVTVVFHAGTGTLTPYNSLIAYITERSQENEAVMGFTFGDEAEYLAIPTDKIFENLGKKYGRILSELGFTEYTLIGHCVGGLIALETAHYLKDKGKNVSSVTLLSTSIPHKKEETVLADLDMKIFETAVQTSLYNELLLERTFASLIDADIKKAGHQVDNDTLQQVIEYLIFNNGGNITVQALCSLTGKFAEVGAEFQRLHSMSATERMNDLYTTIERPNGQLMEHQRKMLNVLFRVFAQNFRCVSSYIPKVYTGKMRVFDCESAIANFFPSLFSEDKKTWEQYAQGEFLFDTMKGDHISCMNSPYIEENVKKILDL